MLGLESVLWCLRGERVEGIARAPALSVRRMSGWKCILRFWLLVEMGVEGCYGVI